MPTQKNFDPTLSREEIIDVVSQARQREEPVVLTPQDKQVSFFCNVLEIDDTWVVLKNPIPPPMAPYILTSKSFGLFCRSYWLQSEEIVPYGTNLRFRIPDSASLGQSRNLERVYFSPKENAVVEIHHPFDPGTILRRRVFDLSAGGMSFRARKQTPFIQPGRLLPTCQIYLQGIPYEKRKGRVVYVKQIIDVNAQSYFQVGVQFADPDEEDNV